MSSATPSASPKELLGLRESPKRKLGPAKLDEGHGFLITSLDGYSDVPGQTGQGESLCILTLPERKRRERGQRHGFRDTVTVRARQLQRLLQTTFTARKIALPE